MLLIIVLQLINIFEGVSAAEYETLCTSNTCFTLHMDTLSFEDARQRCVDNGGYLMTVRDREEEDVLRSLLSTIRNRHPQDRAFVWIGLKLHKANCRSDKPLRGFKWISGEEDSHYSNWEREPVVTCIGERCVKVHTLSGHSHLKWSDGACKRKHPYACKFYFKGMCKPLALLGPGQITYTVPFSNESQRGEMQLFPMGTYAEISCHDQQHYSVCMGTDDGYLWHVPGPFCKAGKQNCAIRNGGCEHLCHQDGDEVRCTCKDGYELESDGLACRVKNLCTVDTCEHQCVMGESGYSCKCPDGFKLAANLRNCSDIDECQSQACEHVCINTPGSYTCECKDGYKMVDGTCSKVDVCMQLGCEHSCLNSTGSYSCDCNQGFTLSQDGRSCEDVDECVRHDCQGKCINTIGSYRCTCAQGFHLQMDGLTCVPDVTDPPAAPSDDPPEEDRQENFTESLTRTTVELQHQSPHTDAPLPELVNATPSDRQTNASSVTSVAKTLNPKLLICVLGSLIPLLLLIVLTLAIVIYRCSHFKKEGKKNTTTDGYCWVSSGLDPRLEKLYESILTD